MCAVQYKCVTDAQRRKAALPGRGLEYVDSEGVKHPAVENVTFMAADGVTMPLQVLAGKVGGGMPNRRQDGGTLSG